MVARRTFSVGDIIPWKGSGVLAGVSRVGHPSRILLTAGKRKAGVSGAVGRSDGAVFVGELSFPAAGCIREGGGGSSCGAAPER